jgi:hypothetical protein
MAIIRLSALDDLDVPTREHRWTGLSMMAPMYFDEDVLTYTLPADPRATMGLAGERQFAEVLGDKEWWIIAAAQTVCYRVDVRRRLVYNLPEKELEENIAVCEIGVGRAAEGLYHIVNPRSDVVTVDHNPEANPDYCCDARLLPEKWTDRFAEVWANHILEHIPYADTDTALVEWVRILKPGGVLKVGVPDIGAAGRMISNGEPPSLALLGVLYGDQGNSYWKQHQDGGIHMAGFTKKSLADAMTRAGLIDVAVRQEGDLAMEAVGRKPKEET